MKGGRLLFCSGSTSTRRTGRGSLLTSIRHQLQEAAHTSVALVIRPSRPRLRFNLPFLPLHCSPSGILMERWRVKAQVGRRLVRQKLHIKCPTASLTFQLWNRLEVPTPRRIWLESSIIIVGYFKLHVCTLDQVYVLWSVGKKIAKSLKTGETLNSEIVVKWVGKNE